MEKTGRSAFGQRLAEARKHARMTQINAAKAVKMSQGTLAELENDGIGSSYTAQLADIYKVDANWLATGKGRMLDSTVQSVPENPANVELVVGIPETYVDAADFAKLVDLFARSTRHGRINILESAEVAEKIAVGRKGKAVKD